METPDIRELRATLIRQAEALEAVAAKMRLKAERLRDNDPRDDEPPQRDRSMR